MITAKHPSSKYQPNKQEEYPMPEDKPKWIGEYEGLDLIFRNTATGECRPATQEEIAESNLQLGVALAKAGLPSIAEILQKTRESGARAEQIGIEIAEMTSSKPQL